MLVVITPERPSSAYLSACNLLFERGLQALHLRLVGANRETYIRAIQHIKPKYRPRLVLCDHFDLVELAGLGGVHLSVNKRDLWQAHIGKGRVSVSAHSIEDLQALPFRPTYALLSPVFESLSKQGYNANYSLRDQAEVLRTLPYPVLGLGGITPDNIDSLKTWGFSGGAVLGYLAEAWATSDQIETQQASLVEAFMCFDKPKALSVGGHDPSSGAGITADIRMFEAEDAYPLSVCSALTIQHEKHFEKLLPPPSTYLRESLNLLMQRHRPTAMKIGLTASWSDVLETCRICRTEGVKYIVWDPILGATAGKGLLHSKPEAQMLSAILKHCTLITPNLPEAELLFGSTEPEHLQRIAQAHDCAILLKGGHSKAKEQFVEDLFIYPSGQVLRFIAPRLPYSKHGTGCNLSAAITARLAQGYNLAQACHLAQQALQNLLSSSLGLLGTPKQALQATKVETLKLHPLQYVTNGANEAEILHLASKALLAGVRWIQLRMKEASHHERLNTAIALKELMRPYPDAILIIDDDVEAALLSKADGVHLGLSDIPIAEARQRLGWHKIIGGTCNRPEDLNLRALEGVDYVGCGPWRMTQTKKNLSPLLGREGLAQLINFNKSLPQPLAIYAIGGIELDDIPWLMALGCQGIALSGLIEHAEDVVQNAKNILNILAHKQ